MVHDDRTRGGVVALLVPALCVAGFALSIVLETRLPADLDGSELFATPGWQTAATGLVLGVLAAVILRSDARQRFGWALAWAGLFWSVDGVAESYLRTGLATDDALPGMTFTAWFFLRFASLLPATIGLIVLLFPTGRFVPGRWRVASIASVAVWLGTALIFVLAPSEGFDGRGRLPPGTDPDPTTINALGGLPDVPLAVVLGVFIASFVVPMATTVVRYRRSRDVERDQMRWLLWAVVAIALMIALTLLLDLGTGESVLLFVSVNLAPVAMTVAVVSPRLFDIERLLGSTLVYGSLSVLVLLIDLAVLAGLTSVLGDALDQRQVVLVVLLLSVVLYGPLRAWLWSTVRRAMLGDRTNPYDVVAGLASTLERADEGSEQLAAVADAVAAAFGIGYVRLEVDRARGERLVATHGTGPAEVRTLPIIYREQEVGRAVLPVRGLRSRLSRRDEELLGDLVRQAATAARTSQLADELQDNRERLVVAREEERRRIRRDLHDGLGPSLSGVVYQLESARLLVDRDPVAAKQTIGATSALVQDVVADVRRLVHDLRPPALDDLGLVGALRQQAERLSTTGPETTVEADDLGQLSAAVEVAAYRIVGEALTNVTRHAAASAAVARLEVVHDELALEVTDDGVGIPADVQAGVGLVSLRERAAELGGRTEVSCPAEGGTVVRAWLPLTRTTPTTTPTQDRKDER